MTLWHESNLAAGTNFNGVAVNLGTPAYAIPLTVKSVAKSAGWLVDTSGDGNAIQDTTGDVFTAADSLAFNSLANAFGEATAVNSPKIARSFLNNLCWFNIKPPAGAGTGELSWQMEGATTDVVLYSRLKFSAGGYGTTSMSATRVPAATGGDEVVLFGSGTDASPTGDLLVSTSLGARSSRLLCGFSDSTTEAFGYVVVWDNNTDTVLFCIIWDTVVNRLASGDTSTSYVALTYSGSGNPTLAILGDESTISTNGHAGGTRMGATGTQKANLGGLANSSGTLIKNLGLDSAGKLGSALAPVVHRRASLATPTGIKGTLANVRWAPEAAPLGKLYSVGGGTYNYVAFGDIWLPYNYSGTHGSGSQKVQR